MKFKTFFVGALFVGSAAVAIAGEDDPRRTGLAVFPIKNSESFKVIYRGESVGKVKLNIFNSEGALVMAESIRGYDGFIIPLNFSGLSSGEYTLEIIDGATRKVEKIVYQPAKVIKHIHVSKIAGADSKYLLSISNSGNEVIGLKIFDANENLIYTEDTAIRGDFAQVYKLTGGSSTYTFEVTDKSGTTKTIRL
jgi:hypothetical protein